MGTPGVGKSTLCAELIKGIDMELIEVNKVAKMRDCYCGYDPLLESPVLDEDKIVNELDPIMECGGKLVEYHSSDLFPERWFDFVFVLSTDNTILYDRLKQRGYSDVKVQKNVECEIFNTLLDEAKNAYGEHVVYELPSNNDKDIEQNIKTVLSHIDAYIKSYEHNMM